MALLSGKKNCKKIEGIICINAALKLNDLRIKTLVPAVNLWNEIVSSVNIEDFQKDSVDNIAEYPKINYDKHYVKSIFQLNVLMDITSNELKNITKPTLVIQGKYDPVVNPESAKDIYLSIQSKDKAIVYLNREKHVIIKQSNNKEIFDEIIKFIQY